MCQFSFLIVLLSWEFSSRSRRYRFHNYDYETLEKTKEIFSDENEEWNQKKFLLQIQTVSWIFQLKSRTNQIHFYYKRCDSQVIYCHGSILLFVGIFHRGRYDISAGEQNNCWRIYLLWWFIYLSFLRGNCLINIAVTRWVSFDFLEKKDQIFTLNKWSNSFILIWIKQVTKYESRFYFYDCSSREND